MRFCIADALSLYAAALRGWRSACYCRQNPQITGNGRHLPLTGNLAQKMLNYHLCTLCTFRVTDALVK